MRDIHEFSGRLGNEMFRHAYLYSQVRKGVIPDVYVQDYKYFEEYRDDIKQMFSDGIGLLPYVAIHLRRGDYVNNPFYVDLAMTGYYIDATNIFPNRQFLVFSDDLEFARKYFTGDKFGFDESTDPVESMNKFASCNDHIIANSSWSWWGAFLSPHHGKAVYPKFWFADGQQRVTFPQDWLGV